jgi:hypothetical protein
VDGAVEACIVNPAKHMQAVIEMINIARRAGAFFKVYIIMRCFYVMDGFVGRKSGQEFQNTKYAMRSFLWGITLI